MVLTSVRRSTVPLALISARSVAKLTATESTPSTLLSAFSTRPTHEAQVMPSTGKLIEPVGLVGVFNSCLLIVHFNEIRRSVQVPTVGRSTGDIPNRKIGCGRRLRCRIAGVWRGKDQAEAGWVVSCGHVSGSARSCAAVITRFPRLVLRR